MEQKKRINYDTETLGDMFISLWLALSDGYQSDDDNSEQEMLNDVFEYLRQFCADRNKAIDIAILAIKEGGKAGQFDQLNKLKADDL